MKKNILLLSLILIVVSAPAYAAGNKELVFSPYYLAPGDNDAWESAFGVEAKYIIWDTSNLGFALAGGFCRWDVNDKIQVEEDLVGKLDGSAMTYPLGASMLYKPAVGGSSDITLEGGLRYVFVKSDIEAKAEDAEYIYQGDIDIEDGIVGIIGANIDFPLSPTSKIGFGAGYQLDISKGSVSIEGVDLDDENKLKGFFMRFGLNVKM